MAIIEPIAGKRINLRCAEASDAEFTLSIRNDPELTRFIPRVNSDYETQKKWIVSQQDASDSCFLVYERKNHECIGTISYYDFDTLAKKCEIGRYISYGTAMENVEAVLLLLDYLFEETDINEVTLNNDAQNNRIIKFWEKFGATFNTRISMNGWIAAQYKLTKESYYVKREKILALL